MSCTFKVPEIKMGVNTKMNSKICICRTFLMICLFAFISFSTISAQNARDEQYPYDQKAKDEAPPLRERMFFGGYFGLQFGTITDIQVAPVIGLWVLPRVAIAVGPSYQYYKDPYYTSNIYGVKSYAEFVVIQNIKKYVTMGSNTGIFLHAEDDLLNMESSLLFGSNLSGRSTVNTFLAGAGISQQLGGRSSVNFIVLWALYDKYAIYSNPEIRISFNF